MKKNLLMLGRRNPSSLKGIFQLKTQSFSKHISITYRVYNVLNDPI